MNYLGQFAVVHLVLHVICICVAYWALNALRLEQLFKRAYKTNSNLYDIFAILLGTSVSNFIIDLMQYSTQVKYLLK